jgi:L-rhamnose mutarotase
MNELWQEICFTLKDIPTHSDESRYEQKIIQSLEKLGWSKFKKEIVLKKNIQIGSSGRIIPDIIVKSLENNKSFVIEVKKPSANVENKSHKRQLFSYMRQLKLANGLLIGNKIQIYYDGVHNYNVSKAPILLKSIEISELDKNGALFIDLFHKNSFSYDDLDQFAKKTIKEISIKKDKEKLYSLLLSTEYKDKVLQFISDDLQQNWNSGTIDSVLTQLSLSIIRKNTELLTNKNDFSQVPSSLNSSVMPKIKQELEQEFYDYLIFTDKKPNTAYSYKNAINKISKDYSRNISQNIDIYQIQEQSIIDEIAKKYSTNGKYKIAGYKENGTWRNAIARYSEFFASRN